VLLKAEKEENLIKEKGLIKGKSLIKNPIKKEETIGNKYIFIAYNK
jgi:hypothetical protein